MVSQTVCSKEVFCITLTSNQNLSWSYDVIDRITVKAFNAKTALKEALEIFKKRSNLTNKTIDCIVYIAIQDYDNWIEDEDEDPIDIVINPKEPKCINKDHEWTEIERKDIAWGHKAKQHIESKCKYCNLIMQEKTHVKRRSQIFTAISYDQELQSGLL